MQSGRQVTLRIFRVVHLVKGEEAFLNVIWPPDCDGRQVNIEMLIRIALPNSYLVLLRKQHPQV
jgi:hypothetical protein